MALARLLSDEDVLGVVVQHLVREKESDAHVQQMALLCTPEFTRCPVEDELVPNITLWEGTSDLKRVCLEFASQLVQISKGHRILRDALAPRVKLLERLYLSLHRCSACDCSNIRTTKEARAKCVACGAPCICARCSQQMSRKGEGVEFYATCCYWNDSVNSLNSMLSQGFSY